MKRIIVALALALVVPFTASAQGNRHEGSKRASTIQGELVDTGCYLGHMGQGTSHIGCATKCINAGMPMGVLTRQGTLYLVTMDHDNPDPYNKLKSMAGKNVAITGAQYTRAGMKAVVATSIKPVS